MMDPSRPPAAVAGRFRAANFPDMPNTGLKYAHCLGVRAATTEKYLEGLSCGKPR